LSSRNGYLGPAELIEAAELARTLRKLAGDLRAGGLAWPDLEHRAMQSLRSRHWQPDYIAVRSATDLGAAEAGDTLIVIGAARLGGTRLIDNVPVVLSAQAAAEGRPRGAATEGPGADAAHH
jgi:pantoate--beta-alanine ligase